jgi:recombination protein RecT
MSTEQLKSAISQSAKIASLPRERQFPALLEQFKTEIARALPRHLNPDRMARIALTCFRQNPKLAQCQPASVFASVIQASQLGLEPGLLGQCYLIPYKEECQLQIGYQGLVDLVRRTGRVKRIEAHVVRDGDTFTYRTGLETILAHEPALDGEPGEMRLAYAVAEFADGGFHVEVMTRHQIESIRDRSQNVQNSKKWGKKTPWDTDTEEMWRKTVLRRICKYLPRSPELATAIALDESPRQELSVDDAINGTWAPVVQEEESTVQHVDTSTGEIIENANGEPT